MKELEIAFQILSIAFIALVFIAEYFMRRMKFYRDKEAATNIKLLEERTEKQEMIEDIFTIINYFHTHPSVDKYFNEKERVAYYKWLKKLDKEKVSKSAFAGIGGDVVQQQNFAAHNPLKIL